MWCGGGGVVIGDGGAVGTMPSLKKSDGWKENNKERLKNNILIKIKFWDVRGIVKWYGIMIK